MTDIKVKQMIRDIEALDSKSDEFFKLFESVNDKYFTVTDPDKFQKAAIVLNAILHRGDEWMVEILAELGMNLCQIVEQNIPASHGSFHVENKEVFFDFYTDKKALSALHGMFRNTVLMKAAEGVDGE